MQKISENIIVFSEPANKNVNSLPMIYFQLTSMWCS